jgi:hypothetical protein
MTRIYYIGKKGLQFFFKCFNIQKEASTIKPTIINKIQNQNIY